MVMPPAKSSTPSCMSQPPPHTQCATCTYPKTVQHARGSWRSEPWHAREYTLFMGTSQVHGVPAAGSITSRTFKKYGLVKVNGVSVLGAKFCFKGGCSSPYPSLFEIMAIRFGFDGTRHEQATLRVEPFAQVRHEKAESLSERLNETQQKFHEKFAEFHETDCSTTI